MRRLLLGALLLAACDADPDGGGNPPDAAPTPDAPLPTGKFSLSWTISDGGQTVSCADVGADAIVVSIVPVVGGPGFVDSMPCAAGTGTTMPRPPQAYFVDIELRTQSGKLLHKLPRRANVDLPEGGPTALEPAAFAVSRTGSLVFRVDVPGATGPNCADEAMSGAGVATTRIELRDAGGTCRPTAFAIEGGGAIAGDCPTVAVPCVENDKKITVTDLPAGTWKLVLEGYEDGIATPCYLGTASVPTVGGGLTTDVGALGMLLDQANMACAMP
jgi:hypothetical protein